MQQTDAFRHILISSISVFAHGFYTCAIRLHSIRLRSLGEMDK